MIEGHIKNIGGSNYLKTTTCILRKRKPIRYVSKITITTWKIQKLFIARHHFEKYFTLFLRLRQCETEFLTACL